MVQATVEVKSHLTGQTPQIQIVGFPEIHSQLDVVHLDGVEAGGVSVEGRTALVPLTRMTTFSLSSPISVPTVRSVFPVHYKKVVNMRIKPEHEGFACQYRQA